MGKLLDETGLAELWSLIKAEDDKLQDEIGGCAKIATGTYTGTGTYGTSNPCSLTFDFEPKALVVSCNDRVDCGGWVWINPSERGATYNGKGVTITWGKTVSWVGDDALYQLNYVPSQYIGGGDPYTYCYIALG